MSGLLRTGVLTAAVGSATVGGVVLGFSTFIMQGLKELPATQSVLAMQAINRRAEGPAGAILIGTGVVCTAVLVAGLRGERGRTSLLLSLGSGLFLVGGVLVTGLGNVPLNERLAKVDAQAGDAADRWQEFYGPWMAWNGVRSAACIIAAGVLTAALVSQSSSD